MSADSDTRDGRDLPAAPRRSNADRGDPRSSGFRQRRRAAERARRRRMRRRRTVVLVVLALLSVGAYLGVSRIGGDGGGGGAPSGAASSTTVPVTADSVLVRVRADGATKVAVLLSPTTRPTLMVALPGETLIRASSGFERLNTFLDADTDREEAQEEAAAGLEDLLGVKPARFATIEWADLAEAAGVSGDSTAPPATLAADEKASADTVAAAFARLVATGEDGRSGELGRLAFDDGAGEAKAALQALAGGAGVEGGIPGRVVEGLGFAYFEPDPAGLQAMLGGQVPESAVSVEVQNGSGVVGAAQKVAEAIAPFGYTLLPPRNADGFPDVATTQIYAAADAVGEADRLRTAVGKGTVVQQDTLPPGHIVIVVGKDLDPDALPGAGG